MVAGYKGRKMWIVKMLHCNNKWSFSLRFHGNRTYSLCLQSRHCLTDQLQKTQLNAQNFVGRTGFQNFFPEYWILPYISSHVGGYEILQQHFTKYLDEPWTESTLKAQECWKIGLVKIGTGWPAQAMSWRVCFYNTDYISVPATSVHVI